MAVIQYAELFAGVGGFREGIRQADSACQQVGDGDSSPSSTSSAVGSESQLSSVKGDGEQQGRAASGVGSGGISAEASESEQSPKRRYNFNCVYANEFDRHAAAVYRFAWQADKELIEGDVREQDTAKVPEIDFLTAGFPCQDFSVAGLRAGLAGTRGSLFFEVSRILRAKKPRHFLLENVKGLLSSKVSLTFDAISPILVAEIVGGTQWEKSFTPKNNWIMFAENMRQYIVERLPDVWASMNQQSVISLTDASEFNYAMRETSVERGLLANLRYYAMQVLLMLRKQNSCHNANSMPSLLNVGGLDSSLDALCCLESFCQVDIGLLDALVGQLKDAGLLLSDCLDESYYHLRSFITSTAINKMIVQKTSLYVQELLIIGFIIKQVKCSSNFWKLVSSVSVRKKESTFYVGAFYIVLQELGDAGYRVEWEVLNSTCWVPQNRERVFFVGHLRTEPRRTVFPLREDDGVYPEASGQDNVANCIDSNYWKGWLDKGQRTMVIDARHPRMSNNPVRVYAEAYALQSNQYKEPPIVIQRRDGWGASVASNVSGTLPGQGGTGGVDRTPIVSVVGHSRSNQKNDAGKIDIEYHLKDAVGSLKQPSGNQQDYVAGGQRFRRLTPLECERLQGWPDNHTALGLYRASDLPKSKRNGDEYILQPVADTQRYRMTGNGVTSDCVREIVKKMIQVGCFE
jgi:site-specific DNA-cytosine methylase